MFEQPGICLLSAKMRTTRQLFQPGIFCEKNWTKADVNLDQKQKSHSTLFSQYNFPAFQIFKSSASRACLAVRDKIEKRLRAVYPSWASLTEGQNRKETEESGLSSACNEEAGHLCCHLNSLFSFWDKNSTWWCGIPRYAHGIFTQLTFSKSFRCRRHLLSQRAIYRKFMICCWLL